MTKAEVEVINPAGMHTRPAAEIVKVASRYASKVFIEVDGYSVNAKSIIGLMTLPAEQGTKVRIIAEGPDEHQVVQELIDLFNAGFYEM